MSFSYYLAVRLLINPRSSSYVFPNCLCLQGPMSLSGNVFIVLGRVEWAEAQPQRQAGAGERIERSSEGSLQVEF